MNDFKLTFTLKQHTPIIHFQHDQHGATLRASEVKPKLDKFLIKKIGLTEMVPDGNKQKEVPKEQYKNWFINQGKQHLALDYKIQIHANTNLSYYLPYPTQLNSQRYSNKEINFKNYLLNFIDFDFDYLLPTPYFGNADKIKFYNETENVNVEESKPKEIIFALISNSEINVEINSFNLEFLDKIKLYISEFFLTHNFGARQNKGFGSYTIKSINGNPEVISIVNLKSIFLKKSNNAFSNQNAIFKFILEEYNLLKSGQNRPYQKSEIFKYYIKNDIRWEKRFIKQKLNTNHVLLKQQNHTDYKPIDFDDSTHNFYNSFSDNQTNDYKYIRALLGLAENFEFATYNRGRLKVKIKHLLTTLHNEKIERFASPIFFKIIDNKVYLAINNSYRSIEGSTFEFLDGTNSLGTLEVPIGFDLNLFIESHISSRWSNL